MEKKEMVIVYIITKLELGGAQKVCLSLFHGLLDQKQHTFLISGQEGTLINTIKNDPNIILLKDFTREVAWYGFFKEIKNFLELIKQLRVLKQKYPNLIVHTHSTKAGSIGRWAAFFTNIPRVHTIHGFGFHPYQNKFAWFIHYILELISSLITTHYIAVSNADVNTGKRLLPGFVKKYSVIRAAVDDNFFLAAKKCDLMPQNNYFIFGTIACFKKQKNLFDLLNAFKHVYSQNSNSRLEIIGDGHLRPAIEEWISDNNLIHAIVLHGWKSHVEIVMHKWQAFVLSSLWEGLPCAIVEARLMKLPVLSYNTGGISDIIFHEKNGLLFKPKDWKNLARAMLDIEQNKQLLQRLSSFNDNLINFTRSSMINQHHVIYKKIMDKRNINV